MESNENKNNETSVVHLVGKGCFQDDLIISDEARMILVPDLTVFGVKNGLLAAVALSWLAVELWKPPFIIEQLMLFNLILNWLP